MQKRDFQKNALYAWEREFIAPKDISPIHFSKAQSCVDYVWKEMGLNHPPQVIELAAQNKYAAARGGRFQIHLKENTKTWIILHELAHAMTSNMDETDGHGEDFVGMYYKLIEKFMNIPGPYMLYTMEQYKLKYNLGVQPWKI